MNLKGISTAMLVDELKNRDGVKEVIAEPYQDVTIEANGPAKILIVID